MLDPGCWSRVPSSSLGASFKLGSGPTKTRNTDMNWFMKLMHWGTPNRRIRCLSQRQTNYGLLMALRTSGHVIGTRCSLWHVVAVISLFSAMACSAGEFIIGFGTNSSGQLDVPHLGSPIASLEAGYDHSLAVGAEGLKSWGDNSSGQTNVPLEAASALSASAGYRHSLALLANGRVLAWGDNSASQCSVPLDLTNAAAVAAGGFHSVTLRTDGTVAAWGQSIYGQTAVPLSATNVRAIAAGAYHSLALKSDGRVLGWGFNGNRQLNAPSNLTSARTIASGFFHNLAIRSNGTVVAWGWNQSGQTNIPVGLSNVVAVAAGYNHSVALRADGRVTCWGNNEAGQLVGVNEAAKVTGIAAGAYFTLLQTRGPVVTAHPTGAPLTTGGNVILHADAVADAPLQFQWEKDGHDVPGATANSLSLTNLQLGDAGNYRARISAAGAAVWTRPAMLSHPPIILTQPQSVHIFPDTTATFTVTAIGMPGPVYQWQFNGVPLAGQTGASLTISNAYYGKDGSYTVVVSNYLGSVTSQVAWLILWPQQSLSAFASSTNVAFGDTLTIHGDYASSTNYHWQFGGTDILGATYSPLVITNARPADSGRYRYRFTTPAGAVLSSEVTIFVNPASPVQFVGRALELQAGNGFGLVTAWQWLHNGVELAGQTNASLPFNRLQLSDAGDYSVRVLASSGSREVAAARLSVLPEPVPGSLLTWGANPAPLPAIGDAVAVSLGFDHGLVLRADGSVQAIGSTRSRATAIPKALSNAVAVAAGKSISMALRNDGRVFFFGDDYCDPCGALPIERAVAISMGPGYGLAVLNDGTVALAGMGLGVPAGLTNVGAVAAGYYHSAALESNGTVVVWGYNNYRQLEVPPNLTGVRAIAAGAYHTLALRRDGTVVAWGLNASGQCNVPAGLRGVVTVRGGETSSLAILSDGSLVAWGANSDGTSVAIPAVTNAVDCADRSRYGLAIVGSYSRPAILKSPQSTTNAIGSTVILSVTASSTLPLSYQWRHGGADIPEATANVLVLTNVQPEAEGPYTVVVRTSAGSCESSPAYFSVIPAAFLPMPSGLAGRTVPWGANFSGERSPPPGQLKVVSVFASATGAYWNYALRADGSITNWGDTTSFPPGLTNLVQISIGANHVLALKNNGTCVAWGNNDFGQTDIPDGLKQVKAVAASHYYNLALKTDGTVVVWRTNLSSTAGMPAHLTNVTAIAAGEYHSLTLISDGTVVTWGGPYERPYVVPRGLSNVIAISAGSYHSLALKRDGTVVAWGNNTSGQCSVPVGLSNVVAIAGGSNLSLALRSNGTVVAWGDLADSFNRPPPGLTNVVAIACGGLQNVALQAGPVLTRLPTNIVSTFGSTAVFQAVAEANSTVAYQWYFRGAPLAGQTSSVLLLTNIQAQDAGDYLVRATAEGFEVVASARLSFGSPPAITTTPQDVWAMPGGGAVFQASATNAVGLRYQWFFGDQAIDGATNNLLSLTNVQSANAGLYTVRVSTVWAMQTNLSASLYVLASKPMGKVVVWGKKITDWYAHLDAPPWLSGVVSIAAGDAYSLALRADGTVTAWGENNRGETSVPVGLREVTAIAAGSSHGLALRKDGSIAGWGYNYSGQASPPGVSGVRSIAAGGGYSVAVAENGSVIAWGALDVPAALSNAVDVAAGAAHALALHRDGRVTGWGDDEYGESSQVSGITNGVAVAAGPVHSLILCNDGTVRAFGSNFDGETSVPPGLSNVISIAANSGRSLAVREDGTVVGWGLNNFGQTIPPLGLSNVVQVAAGDHHSLALIETGCYIYRPPQDITARAGTNIILRIGALGVPPVSYQWLRNGLVIPQATNDSLDLKNLRLADAGSYSVEVTSSRGGEISAPAALTVLSPPLITAQPQGQTNLSGTAASFFVTVTGTPPISLQWLRNGLKLTSQTNATLLLTNVSLNDAGDYALIATNLYGAVTSQSAPLVIHAPPLVVLSPSNQVAVLGSNATFAVIASGTLPLYYQWFRESELLIGQTNSSLALLSVQSGQAGLYSAAVSNVFGACTSSPARLTVASLSPTIISQPTDLTLRFGSNGLLSVVATGAMPLNYQWRLNGVDLPDAIESHLAVSNVDLANRGEYRVQVSNAFGATLSDPALLNLKLPPNVIAWGSNQVGQVDVPDDLTNAVAIAAGDQHNLAIRADGAVIAWGDNSRGQCAVPVGLTNVIAISAGTRQSLALKSDGTVVGWGAANSYGEANPPTDLTNAIAIEAGGLHSLAARADGSVLGWGYSLYGQATPPVGLSNVISLAAGFDHSVALTSGGKVVGWGMYYGEPNGLSNVTSITAASVDFLALQADGRIVAWGPANRGQLKYVGPTNAVAIGAGGANYSSTIGGTTTTYKPHFLAAVGGGAVTIWGDHPGGIYTPPIGLSNAVAVAAGYSHNLALVRSPFITLNPISQTVDEGATVTFTAAAASGEEMRYQWTCNGTNRAGATSLTLVLQNVHYPDWGAYALTASNRFGRVATMPAQLTIIPRVPVIVRQPQSVAVAPSGLATFRTAAIGAGSLSYQWFFNGTAVGFATNDSLTISNVQPSLAGCYSVIVANSQGSTTSAPALLTIAVDDLVVDNPQASLFGPWETSSATNSFGSNSLTIVQGFGDNYAQFSVTTPRVGFYRIYEWHSAVPNRSTSVPCEIAAANKTTFLAIDESGSAGVWDLIGTFFFTPAKAATVTFTDAIPDAGRVVVADAIRFSYVPAPPLITRQPAGQTVALGAVATFLVEASGAEPLAYQWRRNGFNIAGATAAGLELNPVHESAEGLYSVLITGPDGAVLSDAVALHVEVAPIASVLSARNVRGTLILDWEGAGILQSSTNVVGPYSDMPASVPPITNLFEADPQRFFRLRY